MDTVTSGGTMVLGRGYPVNAGAGPVTLTLPTAVPGMQVAVQLDSASHATNVCNVVPGAGASILGGNRVLKLQRTVEVLQPVSSTLWVLRSTGISIVALEGWFATDAELTAGLAGKAASSHTHTTSQVTGLESRLSAVELASSTLPPVFAGVSTAVTAIPNNVGTPFTPVDLGGEEIDTHNAHSTSSNPSRWVCPVAGIYEVGGLVTISGSSTGRRAAAISKNGVVMSPTQVIIPSAPSNETAVVTNTWPLDLDAGDYLQLRAYQDSGGTREAMANAFSGMSVRWLRGPA